MGRERLARYSLAGPENQVAVDAGLAGADWFRSEVPRKRMKELMRRSDYPAIRDTAIWLGLMVMFAGLGIAFWGSWWAVPFFLAYGVLYGSTSDSRWHETGHGTAFKSRWLDEGLYQLASFMIMRDPTVWRWSHTRHHTDTLILGRDPEIAAMRPARLARLLANFFGLVDVPIAFGLMFRHAAGRLTAEEADFRTGARTAQGLPDRPDRSGHLCRHHRLGGGVQLLAASGTHRRTADLRRVHAQRLCPHPARRHGRERARPPAQHPHGEDERRSTGSSTGT